MRIVLGLLEKTFDFNKEPWGATLSPLLNMNKEALLLVPILQLKGH